MNAVERTLEYANKTDHEAPWKDPKPQENWLEEKKEVSGKNVRYKYRSDLPEVIKGIDFKLSILLNFRSCRENWNCWKNRIR